MADVNRLPTTLIDVLANSVILRQTAPYIPVRDLLALAATNKALREVIINQSEPWRHLDLTGVKSAIIDSSPIDIGGFAWRAERMDESLTEDDFYSGPLRNIFNRLQQKHILKNVQTMILDGLSVPADLVWDIVTKDQYNVKILSIRGSKNLNQTKLQQALNYIVRPTRAEGTPKLKALYFFGPKDAARAIAQYQHDRPSAATGVTASQGAQIGAEWNHRSSTTLSNKLYDDETRWYGNTGRALTRPLSDWPETLRACKGLIAFDAVLCRGPRHDITKVNSQDFLQPALATVALGPKGCESCGTCPEGPAMFGASPEYTLPLLTPPPSHSSNLRAAQYPQTTEQTLPKLIARCEDCLRGRWCERCNRWWCENCYAETYPRVHLRTEMQQMELRQELQQNGWVGMVRDGKAELTDPAVKVYSRLCVEHCLVGEMMSGAGSNGMWG